MEQRTSSSPPLAPRQSNQREPARTTNRTSPDPLRCNDRTNRTSYVIPIRKGGGSIGSIQSGTGVPISPVPQVEEEEEELLVLRRGQRRQRIEEQIGEGGINRQLIEERHGGGLLVSRGFPPADTARRPRGAWTLP